VTRSVSCSIAAVLLFVAGVAAADALTPPTDGELFVAALEAIVDGNPDAAVPLLHQLVDEWPDSPYIAKARELLSRYEGRLDRSGIVLFYISNLLAAVSLAEAIPASLQVQGLLPYGLTGLAGVGVAIGGSWLLSRYVDVSFGQELWLDTVEAIATANWAFGWDLATDPADASIGLYRGLGAAAVAVAARAATWAAVVDGPLAAGKPSFVLAAYATTLGYTLLTINSFLVSSDRVVNDIAFMAVPTAAAAAAWFLWDSLRWPDYRSGLTVLGALGGGLAGLFADLVVSQLVPGIDTRNYYGIVLASALTGHLVTAILTKALPAEPEGPARRSLALVPMQGADGGWGISGRFSY
jgi:hypothetical protein